MKNVADISGEAIPCFSYWTSSFFFQIFLNEVDVNVHESLQIDKNIDSERHRTNSRQTFMEIQRQCGDPLSSAMDSLSTSIFTASDQSNTSTTVNNFRRDIK